MDLRAFKMKTLLAMLTPSILPGSVSVSTNHLLGWLKTELGTE